jgi:Ankyrin repeats (3 copies)
MANVFVHFEPTGHSLRHNMKLEEEAAAGDVNAKYRAAQERGSGGHESDNHALPVYIKADSPEAKHWLRDHPELAKPKPPRSVHLAAKTGAIEELNEVIKNKKDAVNAKDPNGWTPLHEGARSGHLDVVKLLVENGADITARAGDEGGTALWWAKHSLGDDNEVVKFLEDLGALDIGPEL